MKNSLKEFTLWRKTRSGAFVTVLTDSVAAYIFGSVAIDNGNLGYYGITIILLIDAVLSIKNIFNTQKSTTRAKKRKPHKTS